MKILLALAFMMMFALSASAQEVKYIDAPKFEGQIFLYDEHPDSDVNYEQWYEIEGRGQFVRNVRVPALISYLPDERDKLCRIFTSPSLQMASYTITEKATHYATLTAIY